MLMCASVLSLGLRGRWMMVDLENIAEKSFGNWLER
jgi:hypothetical protein